MNMLINLTVVTLSLCISNYHVMHLKYIQFLLKIIIKKTFIILNAHFGKGEKSWVNDLSFHLTKLEKEEQIEPNVSRENK